MRSSFIILSILLILLVACGQNDTAGADCHEHSECRSGVCDHYKANLGHCEASSCFPGTKSDNNNFFCNEHRMWQSSKTTGELCNHDYECYKQTCFMIPSCQLTDIPQTSVSCTNHHCTSQIRQDICEQQGLKRILRKDQFMRTNDGTCAESMAQMVLPTVCAPCGNGICDKAIESHCNCPEDCSV